jgi:hypothetical protein
MMTRVHWLKMTRKNWLEWRAESKDKPARYLEDRIVYCADCETRRCLTSNSGVLACSVCGSEHWTHLSPANLPPAKTYDEGMIQARRTVDRTVERLRKEVFFSPGVSLV